MANNTLKLGDSISIIDKKHVGYGVVGLVFIGTIKHTHNKTIILYEVENNEVRFICNREQFLLKALK